MCDRIICGDEEMKAILGVSRRHVHLTDETWKQLFGDMEMQKRNDLVQPGQFASQHKVDLELNGITIEGVRVIGPNRTYNQVELAESDAKIFGINPPRRQSGELSGSLAITLIGPNGRVTLEEGVILAERHVHMDKKTAASANITNKQELEVYKDDKYLFTCLAKIADPGVLEIHIDTDEAEEYNLQTGEMLDIRVCGK